MKKHLTCPDCKKTWPEFYSGRCPYCGYDPKGFATMIIEVLTIIVGAAVLIWLWQNL